MSDAKNDSKSNWQLLLSVLKSTEVQILEWEKSQLLTSEDSQKILGDFSKLAESYSLNAENGTAFTQRDCFLPRQPTETDAISELRTGIYMAKFLKFLRSGGILPLSKYHALRAELRSRMKVVERQLLLEGSLRSDLESQCVGGSGESDSATNMDASEVPWQLAIVGFSLAVLLFPLLLFSLMGLSVPMPGQAFWTSLCLGHPLVGIWQALTIAPYSWGASTIPVSFLLWPLEWALYGFLLQFGLRASQAVESMAVILPVAVGIVLNAFAIYVMRHVASLFLLFPVIYSGAGIALIYMGITRPKPIIKTKRRKSRPTRNAASPVRS